VEASMNAPGAPDDHVWTQDRIPWFEIKDQLPPSAKRLCRTDQGCQR
jgi:hypothetical protein